MLREDKKPHLTHDSAVLDTSAIMLHFMDHPQIREIMTKIVSEALDSHTCETNIAELYYKTCETLGSDVAELRTTTIRESNIEIHSIDEILTEKAGLLK